MSRWRTQTAAFALLLALCSSALAQDFPKGPVKIIVPFPAGGPTDTMARVIAQKLQEFWGQSVIVEHRAGAGTLIGVTAVAKSPPDGHTMGLVNAAYGINPVLRKTMPYDTLRDLAGVTQVVATSLVMVANPQAPFSTIPELVAYAKRNPGKLSYGSPGAGGTSHLAGELLNRFAGVDLVHVPYKGSVPAQTDVMGGRLPLMIDALSSALPYAKAGRLKVIATTGPRRVAAHAHYPTIAESYPGFEVNGYLGFITQRGVPRTVVAKLQAAVARALRVPELRKKLEEDGSEIVGSAPEQFDALIAAEMAKWAKVIREAKIEVND